LLFVFVLTNPVVSFSAFYSKLRCFSKKALHFLRWGSKLEPSLLPLIRVIWLHQNVALCNFLSEKTFKIKKITGAR